MSRIPLPDPHTAPWQPAHTIDRSFVKHRNPEPSAGSVWIIAPPPGHAARVSIIIPTRDADCHGLYRRLLEQLAAQSFQDFEIITVRGDSRQGRAINIGAACARGDYIVTLDDDTAMPYAPCLENLVRVMDSMPQVGMAGGNCVEPPDASRFVKKVMRQLPRRAWKSVTAITDSDLVQHGCLIMRTAQFREIGGENELMPRGLDPYLRELVRQRGQRIVLVPGADYHHLPPATMRKLIRLCWRNGAQAAFCNRHFRQWIIETPGRHGDFTVRVPLVVRALRLPLRIIGSLLRGQGIRVVCESVYMVAFAREWFFGKKK